MITLLLLLSCDRTPDLALIPLDAPRLLRRMSLDLRGVLPSVQELDTVENDPTTLAEIRDGYLEDPLFEERLVFLFAERWHTRVELYYILHTEFQHIADDPAQEHPFESSIGEEPLRILAHVVASDRPWSEVVTGDYTFGNPMLASIWPIAWDGETQSPEQWELSDWRKTHYTDDRPKAGVLSSNGLWWRYQTTLTSYNRTRSNAIARLLVCDDYSARIVDFADLPPLSDEQALAQAIKTVPTCTSCHATLDPIGATLFGFWISVQDSSYELGTYHREREVLGEAFLEVEPAWFGTPVSGLEELGHAIAADPRFGRCAVKSMVEATWRRRTDPLTDLRRLEELQGVYRDSQGRMKQVLAAITQTPEYQVGKLGESATDQQREQERTRRMMTPSQMATTMEALTGFRWMDTGFDQLDNDTYGYRTLAGGTDGRFTTDPLHTPSMTSSLVTQRLAEGAASYLMSQDPYAAGALLEGVSPTARPGDPAFDAALAQLMWQTRAVRPTDPEVQALGELWLDLQHIEPDPDAAWAGVLSALLRDPEFVSY